MRWLSYLLIGGLLSAASCQQRPSPSEVVRQAYTWYAATLSQGVNPLTEKRDELKRYLTSSFIDSLERSEFRDNPAGGELVGAELKVLEMKTDGRSTRGRAILRSRLSGEHLLLLQLKREDGGWKIDDVKLAD